MCIGILDDQKLPSGPAVRHPRLNESIVSAVEICVFVFCIKIGFLVHRIADLVTLIIDQIIIIRNHRVPSLYGVGAMRDPKL